MRVAIIHDWLVTFAGAEQVLAQILPLFPEAGIDMDWAFSLPDHKGRGAAINRAAAFQIEFTNGQPHFRG